MGLLTIRHGQAAACKGHVTILCDVVVQGLVAAGVARCKGLLALVVVYDKCKLALQAEAMVRQSGRDELASHMHYKCNGSGAAGNRPDQDMALLELILQRHETQRAPAYPLLLLTG
jgi:hypothetical protein